MGIVSCFGQGGLDSLSALVVLFDDLISNTVGPPITDLPHKESLAV